MIKMKYRYWLFLLAALLLTACSKDSDQAVDPGDVPVPGSNPTPSPGAGESRLWVASVTRALADDQVYDAATAYTTHAPVHIFLMSGTDDQAITLIREGQFVFDSNATPQWSSTIGLKEQYNCIYGYSPASAAKASISYPSGATSYKNGAVLTLTNVGAASGSDLCVVVGMRHGATMAETAETPERGQFYFVRNASSNYVSLLLDHIFSRIDFKISLGTAYSELRRIKIKKLELLSAYELTSVTVPLTANTTDASPIGDITYTTRALADGHSSGVLYDFTADADNPTGKEIAVDGTVFQGFFAPDESKLIAKGLSLVCTYDVYNIKGTRVRENCVSANSLTGLTALTTLTRGKRTTVSLTVEPTYLYQLSEDELDNPGIKIDN